MRRLLASLLLLLAGAALGLFAAARLPSVSEALFDTEPDVASIAESSLAAVRQQNRLTAFVARFTVAVTSEQRRLGLSARKTMIIPGTVRYELDWSKLAPDALRWDEASRTLVVNVPDVIIAEPQADMSRIQEYRDGELLLTLTNAERALDAANRRHVREALVREARSPILVGMAREATRSAVERTFLLPLQAVGVDAKVAVRFPGETGAAM